MRGRLRVLEQIGEGAHHRGGILLAQRELGLGLDDGEWGAELVRGVGDEPPLRGEGLAEAAMSSFTAKTRGDTASGTSWGATA